MKTKEKTGKRAPGRKPQPLATQEKIKKMLKTGATYAEIAAKTGVSVGVVYRCNKKWGL